MLWLYKSITLSLEGAQGPPVVTAVTQCLRNKQFRIVTFFIDFLNGGGGKKISIGFIDSKCIGFPGIARKTLNDDYKVQIRKHFINERACISTCCGIIAKLIGYGSQ